MPRISKGGKYVYGWSRVGFDGSIALPPEARRDYALRARATVILMPGSRTSGGFGLTTPGLLRSSALAVILERWEGLAGTGTADGDVVEINRKPYCRARVRSGGSISVPPDALKRFGISPLDLLLSIRSSRIAIGFAVRGPLIEEARKHPGIPIFE